MVWGGSVFIIANLIKNTSNHDLIFYQKGIMILDTVLLFLLNAPLQPNFNLKPRILGPTSLV
jgi:hypothetical protein